MILVTDIEEARLLQNALPPSRALFTFVSFIARDNDL
jgi:hypothetical protein